MLQKLLTIIDNEFVACGLIPQRNIKKINDHHKIFIFRVMVYDTNVCVVIRGRIQDYGGQVYN